MNRILDSLNKKIKSAKAGMARKIELENEIILLEREKETAADKVNILFRILQKEEHNVSKLEKASLRKALYTINRNIDIEIGNAKARAASANQEYESENEKLNNINKKIESNKSELRILSDVQNEFKSLCDEKFNYLINNPTFANESLLKKSNQYNTLKTIEDDLLKARECTRQISVMLGYLDKSFDNAINLTLMQKDMYGIKSGFISDATIESAILDTKSIINNIKIQSDQLNPKLKSYDSYIELGQFYLNSGSLIDFLEFNHTWRTRKEGKYIMLKAKTELDIIINNISNLLSEITKDTKKYKFQIQDIILQSIN